jgi:hypothetical protein
MKVLLSTVNLTYKNTAHYFFKEECAAFLESR